MVQTVQSRLTFLAADPSAAEGGWPRPERPALRLKTRVGGSRCGGGGQSPRRRRKALGTATGCKGCGCKSVSGQEYGVQTDPNGLLYMRARYYNPYISRFINADPSGFNGGLNFYAFCNDNPISQEDPFGLQSWIGAGYGSIPLSSYTSPYTPPPPPATYSAPNPTGTGVMVFDSGVSYFAGVGGGVGTQSILLANGQLVTYGYWGAGIGLGKGGGNFGAGQVYGVFQPSDYAGSFVNVGAGYGVGGASISAAPLPGQNGAASYSAGAGTAGINGTYQYYWIIDATQPIVSPAPSGTPSQTLPNGASSSPPASTPSSPTGK